MQILSLHCRQRKPLVIVLHELGQEGVASVHVADVLKPKFLHKTILERTVRAFHATLGLA